MRVMVFQPEAAGHHMILYLRYLAREAIARGWDLHLVSTREAVEHPAYRVVSDECGARLQTSLVSTITYPARPSAIRLLRYQLRQFRAYRRAFSRLARSGRPDVVYIVNLDFLDKAMALLGSPFGEAPLAGMLMAVRFHHRRMGVSSPATRHDRLYEWLFHRLLRIRSLRCLTVIDEPLSEFASQAPFPGSEKIRYVPDAAALTDEVTREEARRALGIPDEQFLVLAYGGLSERKGVAELIRATAAPGCPARVGVLLAGTQDPFTRGVLAGVAAQRMRATGRLFEMPGFLDDEREELAFRAADVVWLGYRQFYGSSGVLLQASRRSIPVIACEAGLVGWLTGKHGLGEVVDPTDPAAVIEAISRLADDGAYRLACGERGRLLGECHTPERFAVAVCDAIAAAAQPAASISTVHHASSAGSSIASVGR